MAAPFTFICGDDDYLVAEAGKAAFIKLCEGIEDPYAQEVIDGNQPNVEGVRKAVQSLVQSAQSMSLFAETKAIWLRNISFLADSVTGRSEGAKQTLEGLFPVLEALDPSVTRVLLTACPVDRRRKETKWLLKTGEGQDLKGASDEACLRALIKETAQGLGCELTDAAAVALLGTIKGNTRLLLEEVRKLATYAAGGEQPITEQMVMELVPSFGASDFFEPVEAFFAADLKWTLEALRRYFFTNKESRPLIASLHNRCRLLLQLRALMDAGALPPGRVSKASLEAASRSLGPQFGTGAQKSSANLFSQNAWYISNKVAPACEHFSTRQLVAIQLAITEAFRAIIQYPGDQPTVMQNFAVSCLGEHPRPKRP
jgi:DNA polymerase-3 subunit delta